MNPTVMKYRILFLILSIFLSAVFVNGCVNKEGNAFKETQGEIYPKSVRGIPLNKDTAVITDTAADIFEEPDIRSKRLTQSLFNQPVTILSEEENWTKVFTIDGYTGWILSNSYIRDISSLAFEKHDYRIIVISKTKDLLSHAKNGVIISKAMMGTEFFSDEKVDNTYRISLPGNSFGWIEATNTIRVPLKDTIPVTSADDFVTTANKMRGVSFMLGGTGALGIDSSGLIYICAYINGITLPRDLQGQFETGESVDIENIMPGDLVFFNISNAEDTIFSAGIYTGENNFIHANPIKGYVTYNSLEDSYYVERLAGIRRIFKL